MSIFPGTWKAEAGGLLEPRSLDNIVRPHLKKKKKKKKSNQTKNYKEKNLQTTNGKKH
jgi:hypothetical protein